MLSEPIDAPPAGSIEPVRLTSATLWYLANDSDASGSDETRLLNVLDTPLGIAGQFLVPLTYREMLRDRNLLARFAHEAIEMAARLGAGTVSLAGILAAALGYGARLRDPAVPVTTGHAATAFSVLRAVQQLSTLCGRDWRGEDVAFVGVGSVGEATARAMLHTWGPPSSMTLVDLPGSGPRIGGLVKELRVAHPGLDVRFSPAGAGADRLGRASLVVGASGVPDVLQVGDLMPGVMIVDDSVPNCFDVAQARRRAASRGDLVFTNGGYLAFRDTYCVVPVRCDGGTTPVLQRQGQGRTSQIASCITAPLLMAHEPDLPATVGAGVDPHVVSAFGAAAGRHGLGAGPVSCKGRVPAVGYLEAFASRFGKS